jgi:PAS domain S-box-containing protein
MPGTPAKSSDPGLTPEWFETVLLSLNDGVLCVNEHWRITCFNRAAEEITGVPRNEALGRPCQKILRSNICEKGCALRFTMETGRPVANLAITIVNARGNKIPISVSTALLKDKEGSIIGGVETFRDHSVVEQLRKELDGRYSFEYIIGKSPKMQHIFDMIPVIAESDSTVLITGESGTGKGLVARAIHNLSPRSSRPFVTVNCSAIPDTLLESELFGYKAGAFTDARRDKPGRISLAQGGTILLDEIGDICPAIQAKLLRLIQDKVYEPLGGLQSVHADVRIIAATNRNLARLMDEGKFRMDLYYRINVLHLQLPPLRERVEDVPLLADHFLKRLSVMKGKDVRGISPEAMAILMSHDYPGSIRELENIIEHAVVLCSGETIRPVHLPEEVQRKLALPTGGTIRLVEEYEKQLISRALLRNQWNRLETARELGIHKTTLFRKIHKLGIKLPRGKDGRTPQ